MPSVTYNGQSFAIDNRRFWILGASIHYARVPADMWARRIAAARQAGFNTIETACPWNVHEPRQGRFSFTGDQDVRQFIALCAKQGMRVILRPGPYIASGFDGGGIPAWLAQTPGVALREGNETFLERVNVYFRKLLGELADLQVTNGGPILLVQSEHGWLCSNREQADRYLREVTRVIRESGFNVPIINANDLWQESPGTIDTWRGRDGLLGNLRQLRAVQSDAPRLLSALYAAQTPIWGEEASQATTATELLHRAAECLAAGAQPVVSPFHGGSNFGFLGGRRCGGPGRFSTTSAAAGAVLGEAGHRGERYNAMRRIMSFASSFGSVFAELDPNHHPVLLDPPADAGGGRGRGKRTGDISVVSLRGSQGSVVFVFSGQPGAEATLLLENGVRMPVQLGDQTAAWFVLEADINGAGRLDYANLSPFAIVGRSMVVFQGPQGAMGYASINGTPLQAKVPSGDKPTVIEHKGVVVVICNQRQIDATYHDRTSLFVGANGLDEDGRAIAHPDFKTCWVISDDGSIRKAGAEDVVPPVAPRRKSIKLNNWEASSAEAYVRGDSPRFASLAGPQTLMACGASTGYGWYSIRFRTTSARKRLCHFPQAGDRLHLALDGEALCVAGVGPGAQGPPVSLKLNKGDHVLTALVDNLGRFAEGNELAEPKGLFGHVYEVKQLKTVKPKQVQAQAVDPFTLRGYIAGRTKGQLSDREQVQWTFTHTRKSPIIVDIADVPATGTLLLNDVPLMYFPGKTAACAASLLLSRDDNEAFKRGKNVLRFAPDPRQENAIDQICRGVTLYEGVECLSDQASWSFAKWEPPLAASYAQLSKTAAKSVRGMPCWWRATFSGPALASMPLWLSTAGLSKGQVFVNGHNAGRYFTATSTGKAVGPQTHLYIADAWLKPGQANELLIFDEHGFEPSKVKLLFQDKGDLDD